MTARHPKSRHTLATAGAFILLAGGALVWAIPAPALPRIIPDAAAARSITGDTLPIWDLAQLDRRPELANLGEVQSALQSAYPQLLRDAGIRGTVVVEMVVEVDGSVTPTRVVHSDHPAFADAARQAATRIRFRPARRGGQPARTRIALPLSFLPTEVATADAEVELRAAHAAADARRAEVRAEVRAVQAAGGTRRAQRVEAEIRAARAAAGDAQLAEARAAGVERMRRAEQAEVEIRAARASAAAAGQAEARAARDAEMRRAELVAAEASASGTAARVDAEVEARAAARADRVRVEAEAAEARAAGTPRTRRPATTRP